MCRFVPRRWLLLLFCCCFVRVCRDSFLFFCKTMTCTISRECVERLSCTILLLLFFKTHCCTIGKKHGSPCLSGGRNGIQTDFLGSTVIHEALLSLLRVWGYSEVHRRTC
jgi:hypothetical protein